jgi:hypothetical protein
MLDLRDSILNIMGVDDVEEEVDVLDYGLPQELCHEADR